MKWLAFVVGTVLGILLMISFIYLLSANWLFALVLIGVVGWLVQAYVLPYFFGEHDEEVG